MWANELGICFKGGKVERCRFLPQNRLSEKTRYEKNSWRGNRRWFLVFLANFHKYMHQYLHAFIFSHALKMSRANFNIIFSLCCKIFPDFFANQKRGSRNVLTKDKYEEIRKGSSKSNNRINTKLKKTNFTSGWSLHSWFVNSYKLRRGQTWRGCTACGGSLHRRSSASPVGRGLGKGRSCNKERKWN